MEVAPALFLDVQMPELDGFDVLRALDPETLPVVLFITAYDTHALKAFEVHALDYLLKPFERERFRVAMERARERLAPRGGEAAARRLVELLDRSRRPAPRASRAPPGSRTRRRRRSNASMRCSTTSSGRCSRTCFAPASSPSDRVSTKGPRGASSGAAPRGSTMARCIPG